LHHALGSEPSKISFFQTCSYLGDRPSSNPHKDTSSKSSSKTLDDEKPPRISRVLDKKDITSTETSLPEDTTSDASSGMLSHCNRLVKWQLSLLLKHDAFGFSHVLCHALMICCLQVALLKAMLEDLYF